MPLMSAADAGTRSVVLALAATVPDPGRSSREHESATVTAAAERRDDSVLSPRQRPTVHTQVWCDPGQFETGRDTTPGDDVWHAEESVGGPCRRERTVSRW